MKKHKWKPTVCHIVNVNVNNRVMKHHYCAVYAGNDKKVRLQRLSTAVAVSAAGSQSLSSSEFETVGPATEKARQPKVLSR